MIRVMLVDDHPVVREGLTTVLQDQPEFEVVGAAATAEAATALAERLRPDVILLDLELPGADGAEALPALRAAAPGARVLIFTAFGAEERIFGALRAGASGYLLKGAPAEEIARAIRAVYAGGAYLDAGVAAKVVAGARGEAARGPGLTPREREVLQAVSEGRTNGQIGRALGIAERTVKFHVGSVLEKLGAESRAQAVRIAMERGLI